MSYTLTVTINAYHLALVGTALVLFGLAYNAWVAGLEDKGHDRGYMGFIVAIGCAVTGLGFGLATSLWLLIPLLACFAASGAPMMVGSIRRHIAARDAEAAERQRLAQDRLGDD